MFGQWRLTIRQAKEAIRADRFAEALEIANRPEVADHYQAVKLRQAIADQLLARAKKHMDHNQWQAAADDLRDAERAGATREKLIELREKMGDQGARQLLALLDAGDPGQAVVQADEFRVRGADSAELRRLREVAATWVRANRLAAIGDFHRAAEAMATARNQLKGHAVLAERVRAVEAARDQAGAIRRDLQKALAAQNWADVLPSAEMFLELAPDCREVKQTRDEALRRLGVRVTETQPAPNIEPLPRFAQPGNALRNRFILWVDGVGGFMACTANVVTLGQANPATTVDIPILGDLSRHHATIVRDGEGYLIRSDRELQVNGRTTTQVALRHLDVIRLGSSVDLKFTMPCPISNTARLDLISRHRLHLSLAGILLMADTCVIGPSRQTHVQTSEGTGQIVIFRQADQLGCRGPGVIEIDGQPHEGRGTLRWTSRVLAGDVSLSLEPLSSPLCQV